MVNAMELLNNWRNADQLNALRAQQMEREAQMQPYQIEAAKLNMLAKRQAMQQDEMRRNALQQYGATGNINALAMGDPETAAKLRMNQDTLGQRERMMREQMAMRERLLAQRGTKGNPAPSGFRWTADGNLERIPGGPADLKAEAELQKKAAGAGDVDVALGTLRDAYDRLEKGGGITSTENSAAGNIIPSLSASGPGQAMGRMFGTQNQSARNDIAMARPALLAALMRATGMSAKQMDSNAELKLWLSTATDPTLDVQSNRRALQNIEKKYLGGAKLGGPADRESSGGASGGWDDAKESRYQELLRKRNGAK